LPDTLVLAIPDGTAKLPAALDKPPRPAPVTAWLCRGAACLEPIGDLEALKRACRERRGGRAQGLEIVLGRVSVEVVDDRNPPAGESPPITNPLGINISSPSLSISPSSQSTRSSLSERNWEACCLVAASSAMMWYRSRWMSTSKLRVCSAPASERASPSAAEASSTAP